MEDQKKVMPKEDKVPLRDNRSSTHGKLYLRHDLVLFNVSFLLDLWFIYKEATLIFWKGYQDNHQL